jgi:ribosomal protein S18 acetylase RimI-like enzyme
MLRIFQAKTPVHYKKVKSLFIAYADALDFKLDFQGFDQELASLPGEYAPPDGCIYLAEVHGPTAGCIALRKLEGGICEMKRLYVAPEHRGKGTGRDLARRLIREAGLLGYQRMRLDTVKAMKAANALYRSLGFRRIDAYCHNPLDGASFYELNLLPNR